jgi:glycerophosphoryl diester phosphodiesterase
LRELFVQRLPRDSEFLLPPGKDVETKERDSMSRSAWRVLVAAVIAAVATAIPGAAAADARHPSSGGKDHAVRQFDVQAHRGGLAWRPESTLSSFAHGLEIGVSTLEMDVQITQDGKDVITHDRKVDGTKCKDTAPVTPGDPEFPYVGKFVNTLTFAQVETLDCGSLTLPQFPGQRPSPGARMPTLRQVLDLVERYHADDVKLNVEDKVEAAAPQETAPSEQFVQVTAAEIRKAGFLERVTIQSFDWGTLMRMRQVEPRLPLVALTEPDFLQVGQPGKSVFWVGWTSTTSAAVPCGRPSPSGRRRCRRCTATRRAAPSTTPTTCRSSPRRWSTRRTRRA